MSAHLGGYVPGGDAATFYPLLWRWLVDELGVASVIDVGCGDGVALREFAEYGCTVLGVEGTAQDDERIVQHDYVLGPYRPEMRFDLAWCCEFVEHVGERYLPNFLATFQAADLVALTHAFPGQAGHHHVNCQPVDYWLGALAAIGFQIDEDTTQTARVYAAANSSPWNHFVRSGLVFRRVA